MTSNHRQSKHFSYTVLCRMGDSPRFAALPQYIEYKRTKPSFSRTYSLVDDLQQIPALRREWSSLELTGWRRHSELPLNGCVICRRMFKLTVTSIPLSLRKGILPSQLSVGFHYLSKSLFSQQLANPWLVVKSSNPYLRLTSAAKAGGSPQAGNCGFNIKYLIIN